MAKIYLVRHCEAEGNVTRRMQANAEALVTRPGLRAVRMLAPPFRGRAISMPSTAATPSAPPNGPAAGRGARPAPAGQPGSAGDCRRCLGGHRLGQHHGGIPRGLPALAADCLGSGHPGCSSFQEVGERLLCGLRAIAVRSGRTAWPWPPPTPAPSRPPSA